MILIREKVYRIDTGRAVFGLVTQRYHQKIIWAADIAQWTLNKPIWVALRYYHRKYKATVTIHYIERVI